MYTTCIDENLNYYDALAADVRDVAVRAAADSMVADQAACNASLVHYVEGSETEALSSTNTASRWEL